MVAELIDIYTEAEIFFEDNQDHLNTVSRTQMTHMLSRPLSQHLVLCKPSINLISNDSR